MITWPLSQAGTAGDGFAARATRAPGPRENRASPVVHSVQGVVGGSELRRLVRAFDNRVRDRVDDLAQLAGDTPRLWIRNVTGGHVIAGTMPGLRVVITLPSESQRCSNDLCGFTLVTSGRVCGGIRRRRDGLACNRSRRDRRDTASGRSQRDLQPVWAARRCDRLEVKPPIEVESATWSAAGKLDYWVKERHEWWGRVCARDGRQAWIRATDLRRSGAFDQ